MYNGETGVNNVNVIWTIRRGYFVRINIEYYTVTLYEISCKQKYYWCMCYKKYYFILSTLKFIFKYVLVAI